METDPKVWGNLIKLECRKICVAPCLQAMVCGVIVQLILQNVLVVLLNLHIFHPLQSIYSVIGIFFSLHWLRILPAVAALIFYAFIFCKNMLKVKKFHSTRFKWLMRCGLPKLIFMASHGILGFLMAFSSISLMRIDYRLLYVERYGVSCLNDRFCFLLLAGISAGCYYFITNFLRKDPDIEYPLIEQCKLVAVRNVVINTMKGSVFVAVVPLFFYVLLYWLFGNALGHRFSKFLGVANDDSLDSLVRLLTDVHLLIYAWIIWTQIWCILHLMQFSFNLFLSQTQHFTIERGQVPMGCYFEVTLVDALSCYDLPIIQNLAALDLYNIGSNKAHMKRQKIYELSVPGNHPYNWNELADQCLCLVNTFTDDLHNSLECIQQTVKSTTKPYANLKTSFTDSAERALIRQYNEAFHIRRMMSEPAFESPKDIDGYTRLDKNQNETSTSAILKIKQKIEKTKQTLWACFESVPGIRFLFGESELAKTSFVLNNSQIIIWITHGLTTICVSSIAEDRYGVVQLRLPEIIKSLLKLKSELDKLQSINLNGKKFDQNFVALRNAIKRNLHQISNAFGDYFRDIITDPEDLQNLQTFLSHRNYS